MYDKVLKYVQQNRLFDNCNVVITGLSGGPDSVCLLYMLSEMSHKFGFEVRAVHVHHGIRGEEADRDMNLCKELCDKLGVPINIYRYDVPVYASEHSLTCEEAGRILRYESFAAEADKTGESTEHVKVAVAHHMNDQAETVLFNLVRGSGLKGMGGIRPARDQIIRPLLCLERQEIIDYLDSNNISYCIDSTNESVEYTRNKLRNIVIPYLQDNINNGAVRNIASMAEKADEAMDYIAGITDEKTRAFTKGDSNGLLILEEICNEHVFMRKEIMKKCIGYVRGSLKDVTENNICDVNGLFTMQTGRQLDIGGGLIARRTYEGVVISRKAVTNCERSAIDVKVPSVVYPWDSSRAFRFTLKNTEENEKFSNQIYTKTFDYDKIKFGLQLRTRMPKDYIQIDDEGHTKKIKEFFIENKIPQTERNSVVLLADGHHIVWIVGYRISSAYKIDANTTKVLTVEFEGDTNVQN